GGAITEGFPILSYTVGTVEQAVDAGQTALFGFQIENSGGGTGHPFATAAGPEGWTLEWQPVHVMVEPGETKPQSLLVTPPADAADGTYAVNATLEYQAGGETIRLEQPLTVVVGEGGPGPAATTDGDGEGGGKGSPGVGYVALLAGLAAAATLQVRRRR
ncbi:MAG TPA: NEW3 domain-containing protein, partial [Candidatus Thermoplasmatota archaeon]|nr:NEW3 domain-containing protein [Candidatus Thermoplasmatota archaeon]